MGIYKQQVNTCKFKNVHFDFDPALPNPSTA